MSTARYENARQENAMQRRESGVIEGEFVRETNNNPDDPRLLR